MLANGPFWSSRVRTCAHGTAPAGGGGTLMFMSSPRTRHWIGRWAKRSVPTVKQRTVAATRGHGASRAFAHPTRTAPLFRAVADLNRPAGRRHRLLRQLQVV